MSEPVKDILIRSTRLLKGPNLWTAVYVPMIEAIIDIGLLEEYPSDKIPGLYERLSSWLPGLVEHRCSPGCRGGFLMRLKDGTWPGHILEHVTLELQTQAGLPAGFGRTREASTYAVYKLVFQTPNEPVGLESLNSGRDLLMAAIENRAYDVEAAIERIRRLVDHHCLGPSTTHIVSAARARQIPYIRLTEGNLVQFGHGKHQRRIWTAETDQTGAIAEYISRDKSLTKKLLAACGVPVPHGRAVDSAEEAWQAAQVLGLPVVVKPEDGNRGRGVFINLHSEDEVKTAYAQAREESRSVLVERYVRGQEHRLLVIGGKLIAAARGAAVSVLGDGVHAIRELIEKQINAAPYRGSLEAFTLDPVRIDAALEIELGKQGHTPDSVLPLGDAVVVQRRGNVANDCTGLVHPETARLAMLAAEIVGLDIAGIDLVVDDISQPIGPQQGAVIEVNAGPGLLMHVQPAKGEPRPVGQAIVNHLFAAGQNGRIPIIGVSGSVGKTSVARLCARLLEKAGWVAGLACTDGVFIGGRQIVAGRGDTYQAAEQLLMHPLLEAAVIETGDMLILEEGMAYDFCRIGIVTNLAFNPEIRRFDLHDADAQFKVLRTQVDVVMPSGDAVLNAEEEQVADMARLSEGGVILFALDSACAFYAGHVAGGGRGLTIAQEALVWQQDGQQSVLLKLADIQGLAEEGDARDCHLRNLMAAAATGYSLQLPTELIAQTLREALA